MIVQEPSQTSFFHSRNMISKNSANINIVENSRSRLSQPPNPRMHGSISYRGGDMRDSMNAGHHKGHQDQTGKSKSNHFI